MMCALPDDRLVVAGGNPIIHMEQKMQTSIGMYAPKRKRLSWWLPSLRGGLALAGSALAEQSQATASVDAEKHPGSARATTIRAWRAATIDPDSRGRTNHCTVIRTDALNITLHVIGYVRGEPSKRDNGTTHAAEGAQSERSSN